MDLSLTETQLMLRDSARRYLTEALPRERMLEVAASAVGYDRAMWQAMADLGWLGMPIPEKYGGTASSLMDIGVLLHEMGRAALPGPYFEAAVLCPLILQEGASEAQQEALLPAVARGEKLMTLALTELDYGWTADKVKMPAVRRNGRYRLDGTKFFIPWADVADQLLVVARTKESEDPEEALTIFLVDKDAEGLSSRLMTGFMGHKWTELTFNRVEVPRSNVVGQVDGAWPVLAAAFEKAIPLLCSFKVGLCEMVFEMSVEYSRTRVQFGQPIGRFQRVADMIIEICDRMDGARWLTYEALWKLGTNQPEAAEAVAADKAFTSEAAVLATSWAHRMLAGAGLQIDSGLPAYTALARGLYPYLGDPNHHKRVIARLLEF